MSNHPPDPYAGRPMSQRPYVIYPNGQRAALFGYRPGLTHAWILQFGDGYLTTKLLTAEDASRCPPHEVVPIRFPEKEEAP